MASTDTYEDSFRMSGFTFQGESDEVRWEVFLLDIKRIAALCSSQTQAIRNFCYFVGNKEKASLMKRS